VQQTIDSLTAQIQEMSKEVNLATITVTMTENLQKAPAPAKGNMLSDAVGFAWGFALVEARGAVFLTVGLSPVWVWLVPLLVVTRVLYARKTGGRAGAAKVNAESSAS
jgi:molybdopterin-biosynthesis enzyme MoeA-like protein